MKKPFIHFSSAAVLAVFSLLFIGCAKESASDVNQNKIWTEYELFYNKNTDVTTAIARFRFGGATGTLLELDGEDKVTFNNEDLPYNAWWGAHVKEYAGLVTGGTFAYTNLNNETFTNTVPAFEAIAFEENFTTIQKGQANTITWVGSALGPNQNVGIFIGTWTWGQDALSLQEGDGATNIVIGLAQINQLALGSATCIMDRNTDLPVAQGTEKGGRIRGKYRALNKQVQVVE